jgi:hypothetical protein
VYFADFASYQYSLPCALNGVLTVGWLEPPHPFTVGQISDDILSKLKLLASTQRANQMRGYASCEICGADECLVEIGDRVQRLGAAEIWIPDLVDRVKVYAAPNLIVHYIEAHEYLPPAPFLASLAALDPATWNGPEEAERRINAAFLPK